MTPLHVPRKSMNRLIGVYNFFIFPEANRIAIPILVVSPTLSIPFLVYIILLELVSSTNPEERGPKTLLTNFLHICKEVIKDIEVGK